ncbi:MAG TPA: hypothetical protein VM120_13360 [Bryobacteraceae bacterium]|nr:hypothetical protein [Bryobacteraceae bacterium]
MQTPTQFDLVNSWRSASDRPNILVVAPPDAEYLDPLSSLQKREQPCEVVSVSDPADALRLLRRGNIAVVVMEAAPAEPGCLDIILEGLTRQHPPRFILLSTASISRPPAPSSWIHVAGVHRDSTVLCRLILSAAQEFDRTEVQGISVRELLEAIANFPDQAWLRISNGSNEFGDLCVRNRRIIYSESGRQTGQAAASAILSWTSCLVECRELPAFLTSNMDHPLAQLSGIVSQPAVVEPPPPAKAGDYPQLDFEEPFQLPDFAEEPHEPVFDARLADLEILVEEPLEMMLSVDGAADYEGLEPELPDFDFAVRTGIVEPAPVVRNSVFSSFAVIAEGWGELESCTPQSDSSYYDPASLRDLFEKARNYAEMRGLGVPLLVQVYGSASSIAVASVPGGGRLVAVRTVSGGFGAAEETELNLLRDTIALNAAVSSR